MEIVNVRKALQNPNDGFRPFGGYTVLSPPISPPKNSGYAVGLESLDCIAPTGDKIQTFPHYLSSLSQIWTCMQQKNLNNPIMSFVAQQIISASVASRAVPTSVQP